MENAVYLRLKKLGYDVYVGQWNGKEIDFVAKLGDDVRYIQVTKTIYLKRRTLANMGI